MDKVSNKIYQISVSIEEVRTDGSGYALDWVEVQEPTAIGSFASMEEAREEMPGKINNYGKDLSKIKAFWQNSASFTPSFYCCRETYKQTLEEGLARLQKIRNELDTQIGAEIVHMEEKINE